MIRVILVFTILLSAINANITNIKQLQIEFQKDVIEVNVFKKRYGTFIEKHCKDNFQCIKNTVKRLRSWDTVQNDNILKNILIKKEKRIKYDDRYWKKLLIKLKNKQLLLNKTQFVSVVDLKNQFYILTLWDNDLKKYNYIGTDLISSGNINREIETKYGENHYFKTPSGVFESQIGWRSDGKVSDDNVTKGYGNKGRFIFYFGKQNSIRYNTFDKEKNKIYDPNKWKLIAGDLDLAMHANKSSKLMGKPYSHGCIRMSDELDRFLDNNFVLHKNMVKNNKWLKKYTTSPSNPQNYKFIGKYLIIFDQI